MKREEIVISDVKQALRRQNVAGLPIQASESVSQLYAIAVSSSDEDTLSSSAEDWATVSYVHTNSALNNGGMPVWVAEDIEQVLDGLVEAKIVSNKALWFDRIGVRQHKDWTAIATLHCIAAPVICVPPTRTEEYSRYQIPDRWDSVTFDFFTKVENVLQSCSNCGPRCPMEFDSRLLNIAAALRAWPTNEASIGASSRGAYISFSTLDRLQYTIAWYQVLLQIALDLGGYGSELFAKSMELYGNALFPPCACCLSVARQLMYEEEAIINYQLLDDTLVALVMQASRFALPSASEREGLDLWSLEGLYKSPGEEFHLHKNNSTRLREFSRKVISQAKYEQIAANICRGRPSLASCFRQGDKWLCALILSNIDSYLEAFDTEAKRFSEKHHYNLLELLNSDTSFGDLCFRESTLEMEPNRCIRSPSCTGNNGSICLFNHLSGVLKPASVGEFLFDRGFSSEDVKGVLDACRKTLKTRTHNEGIALPCYELKIGAADNCDAQGCGACLVNDAVNDAHTKKLVLLGWRATEESGQENLSAISQPQSNHDIVYSFVTIDVDESSHVRARGIFSRSYPRSCRKCHAKYVRAEIEDSEHLLEIHVNRLLPVALTLDTVFEALSNCHEI